MPSWEQVDPASNMAGVLIQGMNLDIGTHKDEIV